MQMLEAGESEGHTVLNSRTLSHPHPKGSRMSWEEFWHTHGRSGGTLSLQSSSLFRRMNGAPRHRWDTAHRMSDADAKPEPPATPWPIKDRKKVTVVTWPPELDEDTWPRRENEEADEE